MVFGGRRRIPGKFEGDVVSGRSISGSSAADDDDDEAVAIGTADDDDDDDDGAAATVACGGVSGEGEGDFRVTANTKIDPRMASARKEAPIIIQSGIGACRLSRTRTVGAIRSGLVGIGGRGTEAAAAA